MADHDHHHTGDAHTPAHHPPAGPAAPATSPGHGHPPDPQVSQEEEPTPAQIFERKRTEQSQLFDGWFTEGRKEQVRYLLLFGLVVGALLWLLYHLTRDDVASEPDRSHTIVAGTEGTPFPIHCGITRGGDTLRAMIVSINLPEGLPPGALVLWSDDWTFDVQSAAGVHTKTLAAVLNADGSYPSLNISVTTACNGDPDWVPPAD